jgi:hypothetical protein
MLSIKHKAYKIKLNLHEDSRMYFLKEQRVDFIKILKIMLEKNQKLKKDYTLEKLKSLISIS